MFHGISVFLSGNQKKPAELKQKVCKNLESWLARNSNIEPENASLEKEKHLETTSLGVPAVNFLGCRVEFPYQMDPYQL